MSAKKESLISIEGIDVWVISIYKFIESGKLLWPIQALVVVIAFLAVLLSGIDFSSREITTVYKSDEIRRYHVKKVSHIPQEREMEEAAKVAVEDESISVDDIRNRYFSYVISKIESVKEYPLSEQKKGHEGSVLMKLFITSEGKVRKVRILRQARYASLTKAAVDSIRKALPFQPFPGRLPDEELIVKLEIKFFLY